MPGRGAALENLDDDHASAAAWARVREGGRLVAIIIIGICSLALGLLATEQLAGACDVVGAGSLGEQAVVSDAVEARSPCPPRRGRRTEHKLNRSTGGFYSQVRQYHLRRQGAGPLRG